MNCKITYTLSDAELLEILRRNGIELQFKPFYASARN